MHINLNELELSELFQKGDFALEIYIWSSRQRLSKIKRIKQIKQIKQRFWSKAQ